MNHSENPAVEPSVPPLPSGALVASFQFNIDAVCEYIVSKIPVPVRDFTSSPNMIVIRSFDVNKPGSEVEEIQGGVAGGSILQGVLRNGQEIEVRPGIVKKDADGRIVCVPIKSRIVSLFAEQNELQFAVPGGLIGVGTTMDPTLTRADRLVGQVLGEVRFPIFFCRVRFGLHSRAACSFALAPTTFLHTPRRCRWASCQRCSQSWRSTSSCCGDCWA